jgi:transposase
MPKSKQLTEFERGEIVGLRKANFSIREIADILKRSKTTVEHIINDYFKKDKTSATLRPGRPKKLTKRDNRQITKIVKKTPKITVKEITQELKELNISVCDSTVRHILHSNNYYGRVAIKKPLVSEKNRKKRFGWCNFRKFWKKEWDNIIFSDESRFEIFQNDSINWVWRRPNEQYNIKCLSPTVKKSDGIMVWSCFIKNKMGPFILVEGTLNAEKYIELLKKHLIPFINELKKDNNNEIIFQEDNAPCHTAIKTQNWKIKNDINCLPWPAQSPDLNPIENLWSELKRRINKHEIKPKNKKELFDLLKEEWYKINPNIINKLIESMPRRVTAVLKNKGNPTRY